MKYNFIHNYDLVDVSHHDKICPFQKYSKDLLDESYVRLRDFDTIWSRQ